jgi:hypothetical protein
LRGRTWCVILSDSPRESSVPPARSASSRAMARLRVAPPPHTAVVWDTHQSPWTTGALPREGSRLSGLIRCWRTSSSVPVGRKVGPMDLRLHGRGGPRTRWVLPCTSCTCHARHAPNVHGVHGTDFGGEKPKGGVNLKCMACMALAMLAFRMPCTCAMHVCHAPPCTFTRRGCSMLAMHLDACWL